MPVEQRSVQQAENLDGIVVIRGGGNSREWNGIHYKTRGCLPKTLARKSCRLT